MGVPNLPETVRKRLMVAHGEEWLRLPSAKRRCYDEQATSHVVKAMEAKAAEISGLEHELALAKQGFGTRARGFAVGVRAAGLGLYIYTAWRGLVAQKPNNLQAFGAQDAQKPRNFGTRVRGFAPFAEGSNPSNTS